MTVRNPYQGETIYYQLTITGAEAITGTGVLAYSKGCETTEKEGTLNAGVFTTTFTPDETREMLGTYDIEVKIKDTATGDIGTVKKGTLTIEKSEIPDFDG